MNGKRRRFRDGRDNRDGRNGRDSRREENKKKEFGAYRPERVGPAVRRERDNRLRWTAPALNTEALPVPTCAYCGKSITDLHAAMTDRRGGETVHFDCVIARLTESERLEPGETISYIGGGRFGVVHLGEGRMGTFIIKRILEWEDREHRAPWRDFIADHYSIT
ncbi:MAG: hypothetical protein LBB82_08165 [Treponema sp.]|jgi:hypothetical protein|nr:hypothetical protein [Treponema sp.]